jgi:hypothetical protein
MTATERTKCWNPSASNQETVLSIVADVTRNATAIETKQTNERYRVWNIGI